MKKILILLFVILFTPLVVNAQATSTEKSIDLSPRVIDEKAKARDIYKYDVIVKNNSDRKYDLYVIVSDITPEDGEASAFSKTELDRKTSIASWIKIRRGVIELMPGESATEKLEIDVSQYALPGKYYASLTFGRGGNIDKARADAEKNEAPKILVNFEIGDEIVERAQLDKFKPKSIIFLKPNVELITEIKNIGNQGIQPKGKILFYDRRNKLIEEVDFNSEGEFVLADEKKEFVTSWDGFFKSGKYKAKVELEYGNKENRQLQDTGFFWIIPWTTLIIFFVLIFGLSSFLAVYIFKKTYHPHTLHAKENGQQKKENGKEHVIDLR